MNTKKELQWWIEFGQKDLYKIKQKTRNRLENELTKKMLSYTSFWTIPDPASKKTYYSEGDEHFDFTDQFDLEEFREAANAVVNQLKKMLDEGADHSVDKAMLPRMEVKYGSWVIECNGMFSALPISRTDDPLTKVTFFISLLMNRTKREDYKYCPHCGNLFLQVSMQKKYCTQYCSINASRRK